MNDFILKVLTVTAFDNCDDVWWRVDGEYAPITFFVNCNDIFWWGCSDCEELTPENINILEQSYKDMVVHESYAAELFCSRVRGMRPQGAFYTYIPQDKWHLFDACGPEREVGMGNPYAPGGYKLNKT